MVFKSLFRSSSIKSWYSIRGTVFQSSSCPQYAASLLFSVFHLSCFPLVCFRVCFCATYLFSVISALSSVCLPLFISISRRVWVQGGGGHLRRHQLQNKHGCLNLPEVSPYCCKKKKKGSGTETVGWEEPWSCCLKHWCWLWVRRSIWKHLTSAGPLFLLNSRWFTYLEEKILCHRVQIWEHLQFNTKDIWYFISWTGSSKVYRRIEAVPQV